MNPRRLTIILLPIIPVIIGLILFLVASSQNQDIRQRASGTTDQPIITISASPSSPKANQAVTVTLLLNTTTKSISGLEMKNFLIIPDSNITFTNTPTLTPINIPELEVFHSSVQQNSPTNDQITAITHILTLKSTNTPYSTHNQLVPFATISFTPTATGSVQLKFDTYNTIMTEYQGDTGNILGNLNNLTLTITNPDQDDNDDDDDDGGDNDDNDDQNNGDDNNQDNTDEITYASCNQTCNSHYDCKAGLFCYQNTCREPACPSASDCQCPITTPTATATPTNTPTTTQTTTPSPTTTPETLSLDYTNNQQLTITLSPSPTATPTPTIISTPPDSNPNLKVALIAASASFIVLLLTYLSLKRPSSA